jgi:phosphonate transport system substrate-binding protein
MIRSRSLRFLSFLAPDLYPLYAFIARRVGEEFGLETHLGVGRDYGQLADAADVGFVCGLAYVELRDEGYPLESLAAPVLRGPRYAGRPVYYSDVIVRADRPFTGFADLRGLAWSYNEPRSQSGYGITRYHLVCAGHTEGYFGRVVAAGWHVRSIRLVLSGAVDASAIDSHVLALALRDRPELADRLRIIATLGPSTIQPVVAASWLPDGFKRDFREFVCRLHREPEARPYLERALIERFTPMDDGSYDDLRRMRAACAAAGFLKLR